jgi:hypothetical protein
MWRHQLGALIHIGRTSDPFGLSVEEDFAKKFIERGTR